MILSQALALTLAPDIEALATLVAASWNQGIEAATHSDTSITVSADAGHQYIGLSQAGSCRRQRVLGADPQYREQRDPLTPGQLQKFRTGHLLEADSRAILRLGGAILVERPEPVTTADPDVYGNVDGIWAFPQLEGKQPLHAIWEHKGLGDYPWRLTLGKGQRKDSDAKNVINRIHEVYILREATIHDVHPNYYDQAQAYMVALDVNICIWTGRCMQGNGLAVEVIERSPGVGEALIAGLQHDATIMRSGRVPAGDYEPGVAWQCDYCQWRTACERINQEAGNE